MDSEYLDDTEVYLSRSKRLEIVLELLQYAYSLYDRVYVFKNYNAYAESFHIDPKPPAYWDGLHYERLIDCIRICTAFENYNKAVLLSKDVLIHLVDPKANKAYSKLQRNGIPIRIADFFKTNTFVQDAPHRPWYLSGLTREFKTISFSKTLSSGNQDLINLDDKFLAYLKNINVKRNRLHFYKNYAGAFEVNRHLDAIRFARDHGLGLIAKEIDAIRDLMRSEV